jgi:hypothetical protein
MIKGVGVLKLCGRMRAARSLQAREGPPPSQDNIGSVRRWLLWLLLRAAAGGPHTANVCKLRGKNGQRKEGRERSCASGRRRWKSCKDRAGQGRSGHGTVRVDRVWLRRSESARRGIVCLIFEAFLSACLHLPLCLCLPLPASEISGLAPLCSDNGEQKKPAKP